MPPHAIPNPHPSSSAASSTVAALAFALPNDALPFARVEESLAVGAGSDVFGGDSGARAAVPQSDQFGMLGMLGTLVVG